jgi:predicted ribosome quality control (RQC) complex YloA/Tae2 family protein
MRYFQLKQIVSYIQDFSYIKYIFRVDFKTVRVEFEKGEALYFNLKRGGSFIYKRDREVRGEKIISPFDTLLSQRFQKSKILKVELLNSDKILRFKVEVANRYRKVVSFLQLEFTGKHTNGIILDSENRVLEALHHISEFQSVRPVKVGKVLELPPKPKFQFKEGEKIEDLDSFLKENYEKSLSEKIEKRRDREKRKVVEKISKLRRSFEAVQSSEKFFEESQKYKELGDIVLANLYQIPKYGEKIELWNFLGERVEFNRPKEARENSQIAEIFFTLSKKFRNRAENSKIERENLESRILFLEKFLRNLESSKNLDEIELLTNRGKERKREKSELYEVFWIEGYKVLLGKSEKGNEALLKDAKSGDIWLHLKDIPSAHTLIVTDRQNVPDEVIREAGKLCLKFSVKESGEYLVDYTKRRNVRVQSRANVLYTDYKTLAIEV